MSSSKQKKVHYERGTKGSSHHHRSSRDSGVGSSSASDRASLGTAANESSFNHQQIETQRHNLRAVQEALDAANEKIRQLEASTAKLNAQLSESNKENRLLKREKSDLCERVEDLLLDLREERKLNDKLKRNSSSRASPPRSSPPRREVEIASHHHNDHRSSYHQQQPQPMYPAAPQPPPNPTPNPFLPSPRSSAPPMSYPPPSSVSYAPSTISYSSAPVYAHAPPPSKPSKHYHAGSPPNDGKYHLTPL